MKTYRCKCGKVSIQRFSAPQKCEGCEDCKTTLHLNPHFCKPLQPHKYVKHHDRYGEEYEMCEVCFVRKF